METIAVICYKRDFLRDWFYNNFSQFKDFDSLYKGYLRVHMNKTKTKRIITVTSPTDTRGYKVDKVLITPDAPHNPSYEEIIQCIRPNMRNRI